MIASSVSASCARVDADGDGVEHRSISRFQGVIRNGAPRLARRARRARALGAGPRSGRAAGPAAGPGDRPVRDGSSRPSPGAAQASAKPAPHGSTTTAPPAWAKHRPLAPCGKSAGSDSGSQLTARSSR